MAESNEFVSTYANSDLVELGAGFEPDRQRSDECSFLGFVNSGTCADTIRRGSAGPWGLGIRHMMEQIFIGKL